MKTHPSTRSSAKAPLPLKRSTRPGARSGPGPAPVLPDSSEREQMIREAAFYYFEARGHSEGDEVQDWLRAEADIERQLGGHPDDAAEH